MDDIREQIDGLDGLLYSIRKSTNWGKEYGTYAPLERQVSELKDTMEKLLAVYEAAEKYCTDTGMFPPEGLLIDAVAAVQTRQEKTCAGCGAKWHHDSVWCPECALKRATDFATSLASAEDSHK